MASEHGSDQIKADKAAIDEGRCPETGLDLENINIAAHVAHTFPLYPDHCDKNSDYARRARLLLELHQKRQDQARPRA